MNFNYYTGDMVSLQLTLTENSSVLDITGYRFYVTLKATPESSIVIFSTNTTVHTQSTSGITTLTINSSNTTGLTDSYAYDIRYIKPDKNIKTVLTGQMKFMTPITTALST